MNYFTTSLMKNLITNDNNLSFWGSCCQFFRSELEKSINEILEHELTLFLDYEHYDRSNNEDYRNGSYIRTFNTKYVVLNIKMTRDRLDSFYSSLLPKYRRHDHSTDQTIIDLFDKGLSNQDISSIVNHLCGASYSKQ